MQARPPVLVIGTGFTGLMLAVQLARRGVAVTLLGPDPPGGLAYGTDDPLHLLNVPAKGMSAFPEEPLHFLHWLEGQPAADFGPLCDGPGPDAFVPRALYGRYLRAILAETPGIARVVGEVEALRREGSGFVAEPGGHRGRAAALCLGNPPPRLLAAGPGVVADPWDRAAYAGLPPDAPVLILGTGLTMADTVLTLRRRLGHRGPIHAVSRGGRLPRAHAAPPLPVPRQVPLLRPAEGLPAMLRALRSAARDEPWQAGLDGFRPQLPALWRGMDGAARARFLRHAAGLWNVHRHRLPPTVARFLSEEQEAGALTVQAARLEGFAPGEARLRRRDGCAWTLPAAALIHCTGPDHAGGLGAGPLGRSLLEAGLLRLDPLGLGVLADPSTLESMPGLHVLGPATRAVFWEATAVPELRVQAATVAERLAC